MEVILTTYKSWDDPPSTPPRPKEMEDKELVGLTFYFAGGRSIWKQVIHVIVATLRPE